MQNTKVNKCEKCSMDGVFKENISSMDHFYCEHHKTTNSVKVDLPFVMPKKKDLFYHLKELFPLISIIALVTLFAFIRQFNGFDWMSYMMDWMGLFLIIFGGLKLIDLKGFAIGFASYDVIAKRYLSYGYIFPFLEIFLGVLYLAGFMFLLQNILVLIISTLGMYSAYKVITNKDEIRCVCLGTLFKIPMTWATFIENFIMALMVFFMLLM